MLKNAGGAQGHIRYKLTLKGIKDLNIRLKVLKLIKENIEINLYDLGLADGFLDITPRT